MIITKLRIKNCQAVRILPSLSILFGPMHLEPVPKDTTSILVPVSLPVQEFFCTSATAARGLHSLLQLALLQICLYFSRHFSAINLCKSSIFDYIPREMHSSLQVTKILESSIRKSFGSGSGMSGARLRGIATCCYIDTGRNFGRTLSGLPCEARVIATRYSTRPQQLQLVHSNALKPSVLSNRKLSLLPMWASVVGIRLYATEKPTSTDQGTKSQSILTRLLEEEEQPKALTVGERVVQAGKDTTYFVIICIGFGIAAVLLYTVFGELFSSNSVQQLFSAALTRIRADEKSKAILGEPISAHGEMSGRNRRRNISHQEYIVDGEEYMRIQFYVSGSKQNATAHLDLKKNSSGKYECRFLFLELSGYPGGTITIEDNR